MDIKRITGTFRALKNRNFRLFYIGQGISLIGTWMQQVSISWLIYRLTDSAFMLGVVGFCSQFPILLLFPVSGMIADRFDKRRLLIITQSFAMVQAFILTVLVLSGKVAVWHIIGLSLFLGIINAFDMPLRQSFVVEMVDRREDLANAIALNSTLFNAARLVGPTIAGILISLVGEAACFSINTASFIAVIAALSQISVSRKLRQVKQSNPMSEISAGVKYTFNSTPIRLCMLLVAIISFSGVPYIVLLPVFAKSVLHGDAHTLGLLTGAAGFGALAGALYLASRRSVLGLTRIIFIASVSFGVSLCLFSVSGILPLSLVALVFTGFSMITAMASCNTLVQTIVKDSMRGRVMAFYNVAFFGLAPFGSLVAGSSAHSIGPVITVSVCGAITIIGGLIFASNLPKIRKSIHSIYIEKGIIPEIARGMQNADSAAALQEE
jgi:MFS family permease